MLREARRSKHSKHYVRQGIYPIDFVFACMTEKGYMQYGRRKRRRVSLRGKRLRIFRQSGVACVQCGIEASYFALERDRHVDKFHMNLYAVHPEGHEVLMTRDHIMPLARGGTDAIENQQTMCIYCNGRKGDKIRE